MDNNDKYIGKLLDDRYEILDIIGEGGMAIVYKGICHRLNRYVAVKIMRDEMAADEEFKRRFCAESQAVAMLSHPNIVAVYDVSHHDDIEYIVMELVEGITLKQYMDKKGALSWQETLHFSKQIAKALAHAHDRGIIHRDIKPQNIMLLRDGTIKVADFGIAALESESEHENGHALGSLHYIAPEQIRGEYPDSRSDIYSLGIVMYEMLTAMQPYSGENVSEVALKHISYEVTPPHEIASDVPPELEEIVLRAMATDIDARYQTAADLLKDITAFSQSRVQSESEQEPPMQVVPVRSVSELSHKKYKKKRRHSAQVTYLFGTLLMFCLIIALFSFLWSFWLKDIFTESERIIVPTFTGQKCDAVIYDAEYTSIYQFTVNYSVDTEHISGIVIAQDPDPGRSMTITKSGVPVTLTVSTGADSIPMPDIIGMNYLEAAAKLQNAGFVVEIQNGSSSMIPVDCVINTSPSEGEPVNAGSVVYITINTGDTAVLAMPNLVGLSEEAAINLIETNGLTYGGSAYVPSEFEAGTVIEQSVAAFREIEQHTLVTITVSGG